jgi:hypothetical protein
MTYGTETWPLTMGLIRRLKITERAMERDILGFLYAIESETMRSVKELRSPT